MPPRTVERPSSCRDPEPPSFRAGRFLEHGIRLAALAVVLHHALLSLPARDPLTSALHAVTLLRVVELGRPAVVLFFVLSGFVLAICLEPRRDRFAGFAARRAVRLLPPYWAAILVSFALYRMIPHHDMAGMSAWLVSQWQAPLSGADLARHLAMLAGPHQFPLDHVAWSLVHELRLSFVVPLLVLVAARFGGAVCLALAAAVSIGASLVVVARPELFPTGFHGYRFDAEGLVASVLLSARDVLLFAVGVVLARHRATIAARLADRSFVVALGLVASLALVSQDNEATMLVGATGLIAIVACSAACARALALTPLVWLGRASYSLYLIHLPVMLACGLLLDGVWPPRAILALAIVLALIAAEIMFRLVEKPSIRCSRAVGRALAARRRAVSAASIDPVAAAATA